MKQFSILAFTCLAVCLAGTSPASAMVWQPTPVKHEHTNHPMRQAPQQYVLDDGNGAAIRLQLPDLSEQPLTQVEHGKVSVASGKMEYFHALVAERIAGDRHDAAIRYLHFFGKPSGHSPSELLASTHTPLDIVPDPLPREHWSYLSGRAFSFVLHFNGEPLAGQAIDLQTSNGSVQRFVADQDGRLRIELPDDFAEVSPGRSNNRPAEFVLATAHYSGGMQYTTTLSAPYNPNPSHWQSLPLGVAVMSGGLLLGGLLSFRLQKTNAASKRKKGDQ